MINNDILRRLRYAFDYDDRKMLAVFKQGNLEVEQVKLHQWLKKEEDDNFILLSDVELASFLNGFIVEKRGKKDGPQPQAEKTLTNNIILRKLKIALNLIDQDILDMLMVAGMKISKHELSAFFRKPGHPKYMELKDQVLRNFLKGINLKYREDSPYKF